MPVTPRVALDRDADRDADRDVPADAVTASEALPLSAAGTIDLRIIATSDLHASLLHFDHGTNRASQGRGLGGIARQIALAREDAPNRLLVDNGDFLQGNSLADFVASSPRRRRAHPVITAFNALGYDAVTLGNHEFNYGLPFLKAALSGAQFPVVSANVVTRLGKTPLRDDTFVPPYAILKRVVRDRFGKSHRLRIGIIGFAPPQIEIWDRDQLDGHIRTRDILAAARAWAPRLRARGADVIIALAHTGIGSVEAEDGMENAATVLATLPEIDAVVAGHCHLAFPGPNYAATPGVDPVRGLLAGKPAVMPGHSGSHLGLIDLVLKRQTHGKRRWCVVSGSARLEADPGRPSGEANPLRAAIGSDHRAALAWSRQVLGTARVPLHSHFATLTGSAAMDLIATVKTQAVRRALEGTVWAHLPVIASASPFLSGGRGGAEHFTDIEAGPLRMRHVSELYIYPNTLVAMALTGAELADWLERSASVFRQISPGDQDVPLHDDRLPTFGFETIPDLSYAIDLSKPARFDTRGQVVAPGARRILGLSYAGAPLEPGCRLILVTNNHRLNLETLSFGPTDRVAVHAPGQRVQSLIADHIRREGSVGAPGRRNWHFLPMPGTTVRIKAGARADRHVEDIAAFRPVRLGQDNDGFTHYRLHL